MPKAYGAQRVRVTAVCQSEQYAYRVKRRYGIGSRQRGTMTDYRAVIKRGKANTWLVVIDYLHTCRNYGDGKYNAQRFLHVPASHHVQLHSIELLSWKPLPDPELVGV